LELDDIIKQCQKGEAKAQEILYKFFGPKLFAICLKYAPSYEDAQDNFQDGFLHLFNKINQFQFKGSFEGWAKRLMINHVLQQYRKVSHLEIVKEIPDIIETVEIDEPLELQDLLQLIQELPTQYRIVFNLYVLDNYSHKEISEMLGISEGTSKSNLSRAKKILKEKIELKNNIVEPIKKNNCR
jgi:RNA polymerase sigma factor (sigma-70 family)